VLRSPDTIPFQDSANELHDPNLCQNSRRSRLAKDQVSAARSG
jgi:hypothetical protein